jgi:uncharacterized protein (DUF697 family)
MPRNGRTRHTDITGALKPEYAAQLARGSSEEQNAAIQDLIQKTSATAAVTALQPVPVLDAAILTPIQHRLVHTIGLIRGCHLEDDQVKRMFRAIRRPIVVSQTMLVATKVLQWIPWVPEIFAASLAYALTYAIGQVTDEYLLRPTRVEELSSRLEDVARERFTVAARMKRDELRALLRDPETRGRIKTLAKEHRAGKLDEDEMVRRMDAILHGNRRRDGGRVSQQAAPTAPRPRP